MLALKIVACIVTGLCFGLDVFLTAKMYKTVKETGYGRGALIADIILTLIVLALFVYNITKVLTL